MAYNIKTTHHEVINNVLTEIKTDATVYEMNEVKDYIQEFIEQFTDYSDEGLIKVAVFHTDDYGKMDLRMFYTYKEKDMISFNKDHGRPKVLETSEVQE